MREVITKGKTVEAATEAACAELGKSRDEVSVEILEMPVRKLFRSIPAKVRVQVLEDKIKEEEIIEKKTREKQLQKEAEIKPEKTNIQKNKEKEQPAQEEKKPTPRKKDTVLEKEPEIEINISENIAVQKAVTYLQEVFSALGVESMNVSAFHQGEATLLRVECEGLSEMLDIRGETIQAMSYLVDRSVNRGVDKKDEQYLKIRLDIEGYRNRREHELVALAERTAADVLKSKRSRTLSPMNPYERLIVHTTISEIDGVTSESIGNDLDRRVVIRSNEAKGNDRDGRGGRRNGKRSKQNGRNGNRSGQDRYDKNKAENIQKTSSAPPREFADKKRDEQKEPVVPKRRESIHDGDDLPLYGKIEL